MPHLLMYQDSDLRTKNSQRIRLLLPVMCFSVLAMLGYLGLLALVRADIIVWAEKSFGVESEDWIFLPLHVKNVSLGVKGDYLAFRR